MYTYATDWSGGIYATPTILGSRPGGVVAATWCAMMRHGAAGYVESTRRIVGATRHIGAAINNIAGLKLVGRPDVCVVAFTGSDETINCCYSNMSDALWSQKRYLELSEHTACTRGNGLNQFQIGSAERLCIDTEPLARYVPCNPPRFVRETKRIEDGRVRQKCFEVTSILD